MNLQQACAKLNKKYPNEKISFEGEPGALVAFVNDILLRFEEKRDGLKLRITREGRNYDLPISSGDEAYDIVKRFLKGQITFEDMGNKVVKIHRIRWYKQNHRGVVSKIIHITLGILIMLAALFIISTGFYSIWRNHWDVKCTDVGPMIMCFAILYAGFSLITYAFGHAVYEALHFWGLLLAALGLGMVIYAIPDFFDEAEPKGDVIGTCFIFLFMFVCGAAFFVISFQKRDQAFELVKRTPNLPTTKQLKRIFEKLYRNKMLPAVYIKPSQKQATYTGSRVGGAPYDDGTQEVPITSDGFKMRFIMQINLDEIRAKTTFPESGILEFFIGDNIGVDGFEMKTLYYPDVNELITGNIDKCWPIDLVCGEMHDLWSTFWDSDMEEIFKTARSLDINLDEDIDKFELMDNEVFKLPEMDYLLGSVRLMPPWSEISNGETRVDKPLLSIGPDSPIITWLYEITNETEFYGFQAFTSKAEIENRSFKAVVIEDKYEEDE